MASTLQKKALMAVVGAVVTSLDPSGTPSSLVYVALQEHGCTKDQFDSLVLMLVGAGLVKQQGDLLLPGAR